MSALLKSVAWTAAIIAGGWGIMTLTTPTPEQLLKAGQRRSDFNLIFRVKTKIKENLYIVGERGKNIKYYFSTNYCLAVTPGC